MLEKSGGTANNPVMGPESNVLVTGASSLLRLRGIECNAHSRLAEAFFVRKILA
jgi:hypothetical protein